MGVYDGVGERIRVAMLAKGYQRDDGKPDVQRFCWDGRYDRTLLYDWLQDRATPFKDLVRLCRDLGVTIEWLLTGDSIAKKASPRRHRGGLKGVLLALAVGAAGVLSPSPSVAGDARPLALGLALYPVHLIGSWRRVRNVFAGFGGGLVYA